MNTFVIIAGVITVVMWTLTDMKSEKRGLCDYLAIFITSLFVRLATSTYVDMSFPTDVNCFSAWASMLYNNGFSNFYFTESFTDYPPAYMYLLYVLEAIRVKLDILVHSQEFLFILRSPAIIADIVATMIIFKVSSEMFDKKKSYFISFLYAFNPAVILVSSVWTQVDSLFTLVILISLYVLKKEKYYVSVVLFALAIMLKQQSLLFTPMYIFAFCYMLYKNKVGAESIKTTVFSAILFLTTIFLICIPFAKNLDFTPIINQYTDSLTQYNYATFNAYNFYALIGENHSLDNITIMGVTVATWGIIANVLTVIVCIYALSKNKSNYNYYFIAGFINFTTFMFAARMHERYLFAAMLMFLMAYIYSKNSKILIIYIGVTFTIFFNCLDILRVFNDGMNYELIKHSTYVISIINFVVYIYAVYALCKNMKLQDYEEKILEIKEEIATEELKTTEAKESSDDLQMLQDEIAKRFIGVSKESLLEEKKECFLNMKDCIYIAIITLIYTIIAFNNLGDKEFPQTYQILEIDEEVIVELPQNTNISRIQYLLGPRNNKDMELYYSVDNKNYTLFSEFEMVSVFAWDEEECDITASYLKIKALEQETYILELAIRDENDNIINISNSNVLTQNGEFLFDENNLVPEFEHYMNSAIFDEIYHPRTAYEFIHGLKVYETTHPPLGKSIIALGIKMFGMNPFGWRFMGTFFGVLMVPLIYLFSKRMFKNTIFSVFATVVFALDFMHFTQTRLATIDSYTVFFIILMYYFMYQYYDTTFYKTSLKKTLFMLFCSGVSMGIAIAIKWQGAYAAAGLAVIFFYTVYLRYKEYRNAKLAYDSRYTDVFAKNMMITICSCVLFFVIIPIIIYGLSYLAPINTQSYKGEGYIEFIINNQISMYDYHSKLEATHSFESSWWAWIFNIRPIFYSFTKMGDGIVSTISSFGNPAVWYMGIAGFIYTASVLIKKRDQNSLFLMIGIAAQMLPWILVPRITFIYHYFPSIPFLVLMITHLFMNYFETINTKYKYIYLMLVVLMFVMFYPVISGVDVSSDYVNRILEWFPTWHFA